MLMKKRLMCLWSIAAFVAFLGFSGITFAGSLEPSAPPAPTMRTLEELQPAWNKKLPDSERFVDALDGGAVLDKETGLVWEKFPDAAISSWYSAFRHCYEKEVDNRKGWRVPTIDELTSLVDNSISSPSLPAGHPFTVQSSWYWSATTNANGTTSAGVVNFSNGSVSNDDKASSSSYVWCVRGGP